MLYSKLILVYLHLLDLVLIIKPHGLARLLNGSEDPLGLCVLGHRGFGVALLFDCHQLIESFQDYPGVRQNAVQRRHLFVAIIGFNRVLIELVADLLLIGYD